MKLIRIFLFCLLFFVNFACDIFDEPSEYKVFLNTDKSVYTADTSTVIVLKVLNLGKSTVYFICTGTIFLEEYENDSLNNYWQVHGFEKCLSINPIQPRSGNSFDLKFLQWLDLPDAKFSEDVSYKLKIELYIDTDMTQQLTIDDQFTDYFKIIKK